MAVGSCNGSWGDAKSFTGQVLTGRYFTAFGTIIILAFIGTSYIFGLYSNQLKSTLGYDQTTLNLIGFFKDLGAYVSIHAGLIMEVAPPWVVPTLGATVNFVGYFMVWLSVTHRIAHPPVWQMCLFICIGANSFGFANTGALVTCVKNFPVNRGVVVGTLKGYIGVGGAIITQLYHVLYGNNTNSAGVILLIACLPALAQLLFAYNIRILDTVDRQYKRESKFFYHILYMSLALALFIAAMIIVQKKVEFNKGGYVGSFIVIMFLLILPLTLVIREEYALWKTKHDSYAANTLSELKVTRQESVSSSVHDGSNGKKHDENIGTVGVSCFHGMFRHPSVGEDYTILQATFSIEMLILFITTICGGGGQLVTIDNLGQIGTSLGYSGKNIGTFVSLISVWQYLGRVAGGVISDYLIAKYKLPRPLCLTFILLLSCLGHLLIAFNTPYGLYASSILTGFCFGAQTTYLFAILSEIFGLKYYATLFNVGSLAGPVGSYVFNVQVAGHLYDREGKRQLEALGLNRKSGQELNCNGVKCYQLAYIIIAAATFFSALVSLFLVVRTRKFYKGDIYKKFQKDAKELSCETDEH